MFLINPGRYKSESLYVSDTLARVIFGCQKHDSKARKILNVPHYLKYQLSSLLHRF
jgi:hypothetical protein